MRSPHSLPLTENGQAMDLHTCLTDLFEKGWSPEPHKCGMGRLAEETILWVKSLLKAGEQDAELPQILTDLRRSFERLLASTIEHDLVKQRVEKKIRAASQAVEVRYQDVVMAAKSLPSEQAQQVMSEKKEVLEKWLANAVQAANVEINESTEYHCHLRGVFEKEVVQVVNMAFDDFRASQFAELSSTSKVLLESDASATMASLDADLEKAMAGLELEDPPGQPVTTATDVFVKLQNVIGDTLSGSAIPESLKDQVVSQLGGVFKAAFNDPIPEVVDSKRTAEALEPELTAQATTSGTGEAPLAGAGMPEPQLTEQATALMAETAVTEAHGASVPQVSEAASMEPGAQDPVATLKDPSLELDTAMLPASDAVGEAATVQVDAQEVDALCREMQRRLRPQTLPHQRKHHPWGCKQTRRRDRPKQHSKQHHMRLRPCKRCTQQGRTFRPSSVAGQEPRCLCLPARSPWRLNLRRKQLRLQARSPWRLNLLCKQLRLQARSPWRLQARRSWRVSLRCRKQASRCRMLNMWNL